MVKCIEEALKHKGFAFVEVLNPCFTNLGSRTGFGSFGDMITNLKDKFKIVENVSKLADDELGIVKK
jgi:pyruvate/2-oxoacid:ferredoxin oxidoreductase beta subunit